MTSKLKQGLLVLLIITILTNWWYFYFDSNLKKMLWSNLRMHLTKEILVTKTSVIDNETTIVSAKRSIDNIHIMNIIQNSSREFTAKEELEIYNKYIYSIKTKDLTARQELMRQMKKQVEEYFDNITTTITTTKAFPEIAPSIDPKTLFQNPHSKYLCPEKPPKLLGNNFHVNLNFNNSWKYLEGLKKFDGITKGGWKPTKCESRQAVAIIIPYRNRDEHLRVFLNNIHFFLQRQQLMYRIFVINQTDQHPFNRGLLFNIGFREVSKVMNVTCFIFHDVDLLPENDYNLYQCGLHPRHMSVAVDKFNYRLPYAAIFGGIVAITPEQYIRMNGFSNRFWGWGGEDDDLGNRRYWAGYNILRYPINIARYKMIRHSQEKGNLPNPKRFENIRKGLSVWKKVGVNSSKYQVVSWFYHKLFTTINVLVNRTQV